MVWKDDKIDSDTIELFKSSMCYLKSNHSCGTNLKMPEQFRGFEKTKKICNRWMRSTHGRKDYEWGYWGIKKKLFIELDIKTNNDFFSEIKINTFSKTIVRLIHLIELKDQKFANAWEFNESNVLVRSKFDAETAPPLIDYGLPDGINSILKLSTEIGSNFDHVRIDYFYDGYKYWFGELTFYNTRGYFPNAFGNDKESIFSKSWDLLDSQFFSRKDLNVFQKIYRKSLKRHIQS